MKKEEFETLEFRVDAYKAMRSRQQKFLQLKEYLHDPDMDFMLLSISTGKFYPEEFDISCFRQELQDLCDVQIVNLESEMVKL
jgi:hypothetical protein